MHEPRAGRARPGDAELVQRTVEPVEMRLLVDQLAVEHDQDLIDPVGELIASVLDMDAGLAMADVGPFT